MPIAPIVIKILGQDKFSNVMGRASKKMAMMGQGMTSVGRSLTMGLTLPLVVMGASTLKTAGDFELGMNRVQALTSATSSQFSALRKQARELGATTQFSAMEAAGGMGFLAQAGFEANQIIEAMPGTLNLAASAQMELAETGDIVSNILTGYNKKAEETGDISDILTKTFISTNVNLAMLGETMKFVAPIAASMKVPFEQTSAAIGLLGNAGIQGSMAGTTLRRALVNLLKPSGDAFRTFKKLGIGFKDIFDPKTKQFRGFIDLFKVLEKTGANATDMINIFGVRAGPGMTALLAQGSTKLEGLTLALKDAGGTAERVAAVQMKGFRGQIRALVSAFRDFQIAIGDSGILTLGTDVARGFTKMFRNFAKASPTLLKFAFIGGIIVAAIGPLLLLFGGILTALPLMTVGFGLLAGALGAAFWPITLGAIAIAGLIVGIGILHAKWDKFTKTEWGQEWLLGFERIVILFDEWKMGMDSIINSWSKFSKMMEESKFVQILGTIGRVFDPTGVGLVQELLKPKERETGGTPIGEPQLAFQSSLGGLQMRDNFNLRVKFDNEPKGLVVEKEEGDNITEIERGFSTAGE